MKKLLIIAIAFFSMGLIAQDEALGRRDAQNRPHGKWKLFLDANGAKTDSAKAVFYRYTWYDNGVHVQPMGRFTGAKGRMLLNGKEVKPGRPAQLLDGEYECYDAKGILRYVHKFENGNYVYYKEFFSDGSLQSFFDYTRRADGEPLSWHMTVYNKNGTKQYEEFVKKDQNGKWPKMRG